MLYADLFFTFCMIGLLTYGGGYSALPLIESAVVVRKGWMTPGELADMISIAEISPGPFSLNCSTFVGMKTGGWPGAVVSTAGFLFPSAVIVLVMAVLFRRFRRSRKLREALNVLNACIIAVLLNSAVHLFTASSGVTGSVDWIALSVFVCSFLLLFRYKVSPLWVMAASAVLGLILYPLFPGG